MTRKRKVARRGQHARPEARATDRREALLDDALDDTFPASDPVAIVMPQRRGRPGDEGGT